METEIEMEETVDAVPPPVLVTEEVTAPAKRVKSEAKESKEAKDGDDDEPTVPGKGGALSPEMKAHKVNEERTLREIVEAFGDSTAYKIKVTRKSPQTVKDRATGKVHTTAGFLEHVEGIPIDESWLMDRYGGGKYELIFRDRDAKGRWKYAAQATIEIAGEPDLRALPGAGAEPAPSSGSSGESPTMAKAALDLMNEQLRRAEERADRGPAKTDDGMLDLMREQLRASRDELAMLRAEIRDAANRPPPQTTDDRLKDRLFEKLVDGDSARITAVRTQFESEIRQIKDSFREDEKRLYDRFERERQDLRNAHERELALLRTTHDTALTSAKMSYETQLAAAKSSFDTQKEILKADNARLTRENERLADDVKELRAKKEKSLVETAKELETVKEALGLGDGEDRGWADKLADFASNPEAISALGQVIRGPGAQAVAPPVQQQAAPVRTKPRVVRDKTDGKKYIEHPNGTRQGPLPEKPPAGAMGAPPAAPPIDPAVMSQMVVMLENAYSNGTDPDMVARTAKPHVSDSMLMLIRDVGGVDAFLSKVAKLPGSSPLLSTQAGRNWVRKVGKGLVGDDE